MNEEKMGKIAARVKVGGGTCGSRGKKMPIPFFIDTYKHRESIKTNAPAEHGEEGARKQGFGKSNGK
jgi:hypothetical protein